MIGPTTKDLAVAAGVSLATVDRVLNNRPNVSVRARTKVNEAIEKIGFVRNMAAVNLGRNRPYRFRFVFPEAGDQYLDQLLLQVEKANKALKQEMTIAEAVRVSMSDPHRIANYLADQSTPDVDGLAVMAPESPPVRDAMARLEERGVHVVQFLSGQEKLDNLDFVGVDNFAAGATAGRLMGRFSGKQSGKIMVIADTMQALDSIERRFGFDRVINGRFSNLTPLPSLETYGDSARTKTIIGRQLQRNDDIVGIYVMSSEARMPIDSLTELTDLSAVVLVAHERTPFTEAALKDERIDAIVAQNPGHAVRSALRLLRARSENREPNSEQERIRIEILLQDNL